MTYLFYYMIDPLPSGRFGAWTVIEMVLTDVTHVSPPACPWCGIERCSKRLPHYVCPKFMSGMST